MQELSQMLSGSSDVVIDEDELLEELDALQADEAKALDAAIPSAPKFAIEKKQSLVEDQVQLAEEEPEAELALK